MIGFRESYGSTSDGLFDDNHKNKRIDKYKGSENSMKLS